MTVEIKGSQLRIRVKNPRLFSKFRVHDVGVKGRLQRIAGYSKGKWQTQAWRLNLNDYRSKDEIIKQIRRLRISSKLKRRAINLVKR